MGHHMSCLWGEGVVEQPCIMFVRRKGGPPCVLFVGRGGGLPYVVFVEGRVGRHVSCLEGGREGEPPCIVFEGGSWVAMCRVCKEVDCCHVTCL